MIHPTGKEGSAHRENTGVLVAHLELMRNW